MKEITIEQLAYLLTQAKKNKLPQPIFFLGAGASRSGNIPLAGEIINQILKDYAESPFIKKLPKEERSYARLMDCLLPDQRDELLKKYINEAKINVTHIYLAQLLKEGFVDYVLTVNFDNLILRALALFNIFPSTYDMAILKDFTTSTFKEKSVVYLHGQNHGLWLLNTPEEMGKVKNTVPRIFDTIKNKRPWVFIGYSGEDPIFDHVKNLGRFDNGLYWVTYNDNYPHEVVQKFISEPNTNASIIKGYDSDSFMLKLNFELGLGQPNIVDRPFTALKNMLNEIVDIDEKDYLKGIKERLNISKRQVQDAIQQFELGKVESLESVEANKIDLLKKEIINLLISDIYNEDVIKDIEEKVGRVSDIDLKGLLSDLYFRWGNFLKDLAVTKDGEEAEELYNQIFNKYQKAIEIIPEHSNALNNWGTSLGDLARMKVGKEAEALYYQSFEKFQKANEINQDEINYINWGGYLGHFAKMKEGDEAKELYYQSFDKFQKAIEIKPDFAEVLFNWGTVLGDFATKSIGKEAEALYYQSFEKFQKAIEIKPDYAEAILNWGNVLGELAAKSVGKEAEALYYQSFEKFQKAIEIKPDYVEVLFSWGVYLGYLARIKEGKEAEELLFQSFSKFEMAVDIKPNYAKALFSWGYDLGHLARMKEGKEAEELLFQSIEKFRKVIDITPDDDEALSTWGTNLGVLASMKKGKEAEELLFQSIEKFQKAIEIKQNEIAYVNWSYSLEQLAMTKEGNEAETLYYQAIEKCQKAIMVKPDFATAFFNYGTILGNLAMMKEGEEAEKLYYKSFEEFQKAIEINPQYERAFNNWGHYVGRFVNMKEVTKDMVAYQFEKYQKAKESFGVTQS